MAKQKSLTKKQRKLVYKLCVEEGKPQAKVADLFNVSQPTISNAIKEEKHDRELEEARKNAV